MDAEARAKLIERKKKILGPYTSFIMQMFKKFKGTANEGKFSVMYETITNDLKVLTNAQIDLMSSRLLDLQLKENGVPYMPKSASSSVTETQSPKVNLQSSNAQEKNDGNIFYSRSREKPSSTARLEAEKQLFSRSRDQPETHKTEPGNSSSFSRRKRQRAMRIKNQDGRSGRDWDGDSGLFSRSRHQRSHATRSKSSKSSSPSQRSESPKFDRRNPDEEGFDSRNGSDRRNQDPRLRDSMSYNRSSSNSRQSDPRSVQKNNKTVYGSNPYEFEFCNRSDRTSQGSGDSRPPNSSESHSIQQNPKNGNTFHQENHDIQQLDNINECSKDVNPPERNSAEFSRDSRLNKDPRSARERSATDPRLNRERSAGGVLRDPRLNREKSRDPCIHKDDNPSTSKGYNDRDGFHNAQTRHTSNEGWFKANGERYEKSGNNSKRFSPNGGGWFNDPRKQSYQGPNDRYRSRSRHQSRPRSCSSSPSRNQPFSKHLPNQKNYDRSRSRSKAANFNSRFNKAEARDLQRKSEYGGPSFKNKSWQSQGRAQTEAFSATNQRYNPAFHGRRKPHHGVLTVIKDYIDGNKKPPARRLSCFGKPQEPELSKKPETFAKIRQRRMSSYQSNDTQPEPSLETFKETASECFTHHKFNRANENNATESNKTQRQEGAPYPKASEISVGYPKAILAAKKILSKKHSQPDEMAKYLVEAFGPEIFKNVLKQMEPEATKEVTPRAPTKERSEVSKPETSTKVIKLNKAESNVSTIDPKKLSEIEETEEAKKSLDQMAKKASEMRDTTPSPVPAVKHQKDEKIPKRRYSVGRKPGPKKKEKFCIELKASTEEPKKLETANDSKSAVKLIKNTKEKESEVPKAACSTVDTAIKKTFKPESLIKTAVKCVSSEAESPVTDQPARKKQAKKRRFNELDKLCAQINDFHDRDQIVTSGGKRSCTQQPHNYSGENAPEIRRALVKPAVLPSQEQLTIHYKIKHARIILKQMRLEGVEMPVKLDDENRPIIQEHASKKKKWAFPAKETVTSPNTVKEPSLSVVKETKKPSSPVKQSRQEHEAKNITVSPKARKRGGKWSQGVVKKQKKSKPTLITDDDEWEDVQDDLPSDQSKTAPPSKKVMLKVLVDCMDLWSRALIKPKTVKAKNTRINKVPVTPRTVSISAKRVSTVAVKELSKPETSAQLIAPPKLSTFKLTEPSTGLHNTSQPKEKFTIMTSTSGAISYKCELCLFSAQTKEFFINHIKSKHFMVHYPEPCPKCSKMSNGTLESEFRHMLTHVPLKQETKGNSLLTDQNKGQTVTYQLVQQGKDQIKAPVVIRQADMQKPSNLKLKLLPGDRLSTIAPAPVPVAVNKLMPTKSIALPSIFQQTKSSNTSTGPSNVANDGLTISNTGLRRMVPLNLENHFKAIAASTSGKIYRINASSLKVADTGTNKAPVGSPTPTTIRSLLIKKPSEALNIQFRAEHVSTPTSQPTVAIQPLSTSMALRPWIQETAVKPREILLKMLDDPKCLAAIYKCMGSTCSFYTSHVLLFQRHLASHIKYQNEDCENFLSCAYCEFKFKTTGGLTGHIINTHGYDRYQCGHCFFRAYSDFHIYLYHQKNFHKTQLRSLIECSFVRPRKVDLNALHSRLAQIVPPLKCFFCTEKFFIERSYLNHLTAHTDKVIGFECKKCQGKVNRFNVLEHFQCHGIGHYQCVYCSFGVKALDTLDAHIAEKHSSEIPFIAQRVFGTNKVDPYSSESLCVKQINKTGSNCMRSNFAPKELFNTENVERISDIQLKSEPKSGESLVTTTQPVNEMNTMASNVIPKVGDRSAFSLQISSVVSLSESPIVLSSDED